MSTKDERHKAFIAEFEALLRKHRADFQVEDDGRPYGMHSALATVTFCKDDDGNHICEEHELPGFIWGSKDT